jgi:hypothetical protein
MCECITKVNAALAGDNTQLGITVVIGGQTSSLPTIVTEKVNTKLRKGPVAVIPSFCPFCGEKYEKAEAQPC